MYKKKIDVRQYTNLRMSVFIFWATSLKYKTNSYYLERDFLLDGEGSFFSFAANDILIPDFLLILTFLIKMSFLIKATIA